MHSVPQRPGSVTAAAILLMVYGSMNLLCAMCAGGMAFFPDPDAPALVNEIPAFHAVQIGHALSNMIVGSAMIVLGSLLLNMSAAARLGALIACWYEVVLLFAHSAYAAIFEIPVRQRLFADEAVKNPVLPIDIGELGQGALWLSLAVTIVLALSFCLTIIALLSGAQVRAAFGRQDRPPATDTEQFDEERRPD
jgi:hypothetical protein